TSCAVRGEAARSEHPEAEQRCPEPAEDAQDEQRDPPALAAHPVSQDPQLQAYEMPDSRRADGRRIGHSHDTSAPLATRPPPTSTKTSSRSRPPRTCAVVPTTLMSPAARIAMCVQSRSTTSITWLEKMTVPPPLTYRWRMSRVSAAETGSTASNGSSSTSRRG